MERLKVREITKSFLVSFSGDIGTTSLQGFGIVLLKACELLR